MSMGPMKRTGFAQGIYQASVTRKEEVGTLRITADGRKFRYAKAGEAMSAGMLTVSAGMDAAHTNEAILAAVAIGTKILELTVTAGTAIAADALRGGYLQIQDGTGEGYSYPIESNTAITTAQTAINVTLSQGIIVPLDATSEFSLVHNPWYGILHDTGIKPVTGVPPIAVTSGYWFWVQTGGLAIILTHETTAVGLGYEQSTTNGAVDTGDTDAQEFTGFGYQFGTAGVAGEYTPCILTID